MKNFTFIVITIVLLLPSISMAQTTQDSAVAIGLSAIQKNDLKKDIFELASDEMLGRRAGTVNELRAATWVAQRAREAGLEPTGDDGTYFQFFSLYRTVVAENSEIKINGNALALGKDIWEVTPVEARIKGAPVWLKTLADTTKNLKDKTIVMDLLPPEKLPEEGMSLWVYRYALSAIREQSEILKRQGVKAVILIADSTASSKIGFFGHGISEGKYELEKSKWLNQGNSTPVFLVSGKIGEDLKSGNAEFSTDIRVSKFTYPSANVIAKVPGRDPELNNEYVIFSGHHDHDGVGAPVEGDSIWNGADDNASVSVALLAIGRAWKKNPGKRSALFIWHGAEERGLMGSRYFVENPTIPKENIVAVLNGDMIGRNESGNAALLGSISPHKNSTELVQMAMSANSELTKFNVDTSWDNEEHPEFWYYRSDHLPYARTDVPVIFFTTLLHSDYHTPNDEADRIDLEKLTKMTKWMYLTGWKVSKQDKKLSLDEAQ